MGRWAGQLECVTTFTYLLLPSVDIQAEMLVGLGFIISLWSMEHAEEPSWIALLCVLLHSWKLWALQLRKVFSSASTMFKIAGSKCKEASKSWNSQIVVNIQEIGFRWWSFISDFSLVIWNLPSFLCGVWSAVDCSLLIKILSLIKVLSNSLVFKTYLLDNFCE